MLFDLEHAYLNFLFKSQERKFLAKALVYTDVDFSFIFLVVNACFVKHVHVY